MVKTTVLPLRPVPLPSTTLAWTMSGVVLSAGDPETSIISVETVLPPPDEDGGTKVRVTGLGLATEPAISTPPTDAVTITVPGWVLVTLNLAMPLTSVVTVMVGPDVFAVPATVPPEMVKVTVVLGTTLLLAS